MIMKKKKIESFRNKEGYINLNGLEKYKEKGEIVEGSSAKCWYNIEGTRFLFKQYHSSLSAFGEVLYYNVAKSCGVDCAEYDFAVCNGEVGTISYDFLSDNKVYYNCLELTTQFTDTKFSIDDFKSNRDLLIIHNNTYNNMQSIIGLLVSLFDVEEKEKRKIELNLVKMFCLDTIFWHKDRNLWNYGAIVDEANDTMSLAPVHDNSYVLYLHKGEKYIEDMIVSIINGETLENLSYFDVGVDKDDSINQLVKFYASSDSETQEVIEELIKKINVDEEIKKLNNVCKIGDVAKLWIKAVLNYRQIAVLKGLESVKMDAERASKPNVVFNKRK